MGNNNDPTFKVISKYRQHPSTIAINDRFKGKDVFKFLKLMRLKSKTKF